MYDWKSVGGLVAGWVLMLGSGLAPAAEDFEIRMELTPKRGSAPLQVQFQALVDRVASGGGSAGAATANALGMNFVTIPAGSFMMGSVTGGSDETPVHQVTLRSFRLMTTEVTQGQWRAVMGENPSAYSDCGDNCPVEWVSWDEIQGFISRLNQQTGEVYRLPSESEWEYAARAGTTTAYWWGDEIGSGNANCNGSGCGDTFENTAPVGSFAANPWGLYDMNGNVYEWVQDCYIGSYATTPVDGIAHGQSNNCASGTRVLRGGSWHGSTGSLRSANRAWNAPDYRLSDFGFRLAQDI